MQTWVTPMTPPPPAHDRVINGFAEPLLDFWPMMRAIRPVDPPGANGDEEFHRPARVLTALSCACPHAYVAVSTNTAAGQSGKSGWPSSRNSRFGRLDRYVFDSRMMYCRKGNRQPPNSSL